MDKKHKNTPQKVISPEQKNVVRKEKNIDYLFENIVTKSYLRQLSYAEVIPFEEDDSLKGIKWQKISEIVYEKDVFFVDKLSMLYAALHKEASQVVLVIKKENSRIELYLGARDKKNKEKDNFISGKIISCSSQGFLSGIKMDDVIDEEKDESATNSDKQVHIPSIMGKYEQDELYLSSVSGVASLRDDKKQNFVQGVERLINGASEIKKFTAVFIAESIEEEEVYRIRTAYEQLSTTLAPLAENQLTYTRNESHGVSTTISESVSESLSESISKTITTGKNSSNTETKQEGSNEAIGGYAGVMAYGVGAGVSYSRGTNKSVSAAIMNGEHRDVADGTGLTKSKGKDQTTAEGQNTEHSEGVSNQLTFHNKHIEKYLEHIEEQLKRLYNSEAFGLWSCATYFIATTNTTAKQLANIYRGCIVGEDSGVETIAVNSYKTENSSEIAKYLGMALHPRFKYVGFPGAKEEDSLNVSAGTIVNSKELAIHMSLPQSSVPGIHVKEQAVFGRNVITHKEQGNVIYLGNIRHLGIEETKNFVCLNTDALTSHTFVTGTTGSGKSNTMYLLLQGILDKNKEGEEQNNGEENQKEEIKFLVIEPTKGEYKKVFNEDVNVYGSNPNLTPLLKINPFEFDDKIHICEHIDRLVDIFNTCWPMYAAMPVVLKKSIIDAYRACGWNIEKSTWNDVEDYKLYPTVKDVVIALQKYINQSEYSADTKGDYKGSLETRLMALTEGLTGMMLNNPTENLSDEELFTKNVIVDLSRVGNSETKSLVMGLIIMKLTEYYQAHGQMNSSLKHVTVLEEAHNILKRTSTQQNQESSNLVGKSVEMLTNSIAEMRTYGEAFIIVDQSPSQVDMAAIRNTNTKIIMALPESEDRITAGKSIGLKDEQIEEIARLKVGEAVVYQNDWEEPVLCKVKKFEGKESDYEYNDTHTPHDSTKELLYETLELLYHYCKLEELDKEKINKVKKNLNCLDIPSTTKYEIFKILDGNTGNQVVNQTKIREIVSQCIGKQEEFARIVAEASKTKDIRKLDEKMRDSISKVIPEKDSAFYRFCIRYTLWQHALNRNEMNENELCQKWFDNQYRQI